MKKILLFLFLFISITKSNAWGDKGHSMVVKIAFSRLDQETKNTILTYLDGMSVDQAANWMDELKGDKSKDFMKSYHYANFRKGFTVVNQEGPNIVYILSKTIADLEHKNTLSEDEIKAKILFLFHLIGDIHQPLHVGYGEDKGGNTVQLSYQTRGTNLHRLWDSGIISSQNITLSDCLNTQIHSPEELIALKKIDVVQWSDESRSLLNEVYNYKNAKIQDQYVTVSAKLIEKQIQKAGIRLAAVLQTYFKKE